MFDSSAFDLNHFQTFSSFHRFFKSIQVLSQDSDTLDVVQNGVAVSPSFTFIEYRDSQRAVVSTLVPRSVFRFTPGSSIDVTGLVLTNLVGGRRKLKADTAAGKESSERVVAFETEVYLQDDEQATLEGMDPLAASGGRFVSGALAVLGALLAAAVW